MGIYLTAKAGKTTYKIGGPDSKAIDVMVAPRPPSPPRLGRPLSILRSLFSLLKGMFITFNYFRKPSTVVTQQYPENRDTLKMFDRFRARLRFKYDDNGDLRCGGCGVCMRTCPNGSIVVKSSKGELSKKLELQNHIWRMDSCCYCNACVDACNFDAIEFTNDFESAVFDRRLLVFNLNRQEGPSATVLNKAENADELREQAVKPIKSYSGPIPMSGTDMAGVSALPAGEEPAEREAGKKEDDKEPQGEQDAQ